MENPEFQTLNFEEEKKGSSKKPVIFALIFLILASIGIVGGLLATRIWNPPWNPFKEKPEVILRKMEEAMEKVKSFQGNSNFILSFKIPEGEFKIELSEEQKVARVNSSLNSEGKTTITISLNGAGIIGFPVKIELPIEFETISLEKTSFVKLTRLPDFSPLFANSKLPQEIETLSFIDSLANSLKNQWIKVDPGTLEKFVQETIMGAKVSEKELQEFQQKREELEKKLQEKKDLFSLSRIFQLKKINPVTKINHTPVYHYSLVLNNTAFAEATTQFLEYALSTLLPEEFVGNEQANLSNFKKEITDLLAKIGEINIDVFIGKKDYLLYKFTLEKTINFAQIDPQINVTAEIKFNGENSSFGKTFTIQAPKEAKDLAEVLTPILVQLEEIEKKTQNSEIMRIGDQIQIFAEGIYTKEKSYEKLCTEVSAGEGKVLLNQIKTIYGQTPEFTCLSARNSYCFSVTLLDGSKYCVDSKPSAKTITGNLNCIGRGTLKDPYRCP
ncbi:hypothetical protein H5T58_01420 [Candidatus Parcubacteria bacterium]|nr:hypothetical protein [Candidatus Parcubacteria bacterium]